MPYIHAKINQPLEDGSQKQWIKACGEIVSLFPGKSEQWLMASCEGDAVLAFRGSFDPAAFIEVRIFGDASNDAYDQVTESLTLAAQTIFGVPADRIYVQYQPCEHWGYQGGNF